MREPRAPVRRIACVLADRDAPADQIQSTHELARRLAASTHAIRGDSFGLSSAVVAPAALADLCGALDLVDALLVTVDPRLAAIAVEIAARTRHEVLVGRRAELANGIVIATDLADARYPVLAAGQRFATLAKSPAIAIHNATPLPFSPPRMVGNVLNGSVSDNVVLIHDRRRLHRAARGFGLPAVLARDHSPSRAILATAQSAHADVIVVGVRPWPATPLRGGGVAEHVVRHAPQNVLLVPIAA